MAHGQKAKVRVVEARGRSTSARTCGSCLRKADYRTYGELCRAFRRAQPEYRYFRMANFRLDRFTGELEDFQHATYGTWAICVEHWPLSAKIGRFGSGRELFWRFNPPDPSEWLANDLPGIVAFLHAGLDFGIAARTPRSGSSDAIALGAASRRF